MVRIDGKWSMFRFCVQVWLGLLSTRHVQVSSFFSSVRTAHQLTAGRKFGRSVQFRGMSVDVASTTTTKTPQLQLTPRPGSPTVVTIDREENIAYMKISLSEEDTTVAMAQSCEEFNEELRRNKRVTAGFRQGAKMSASQLYGIFGEEQVKTMCANYLAAAVQRECDLTGLSLVGRSRIADFHADSFSPGKPHVVDVECYVLPVMTYCGDGESTSAAAATPDGYKGMSVVLTRNTASTADKFNQTKLSILNKHRVLCDPPGDDPSAYQAQTGDLVVADVQAFLLNEDGSRGAAVEVASGDSIELPMDPARFNADVVRNLLGSSAGENRSFEVQFPVKVGGPGAFLSGKSAAFDIAVRSVKLPQLPAWDDALANQLREGWTLRDLEAELMEALLHEEASQQEGRRNEQLAMALVERVRVNKLPEEVLHEATLRKYDAVLRELKRGGTTEQELRDLQTPEKFESYRNLTRSNVEAVVKLGMALQDVAAKERLSVDPAEVDRQVKNVVAQLQKDKDEQMRPEAEIREEVLSVLERNAVFDFLAQHAFITYVESSSEQQEVPRYQAEWERAEEQAEMELRASVNAKEQGQEIV